jgi:hypothetical protein
MGYHLIQDLATLHSAELRHAAAIQRRARASRRASIRVRAGWTLVTIGLSLATSPPASPRPRARRGGSVPA